MSFYEDSTIADLAVILALADKSYSAGTMFNRFRLATGDADLAEVLLDSLNDTNPSGSLRPGLYDERRAYNAAVDALQGIEDNAQTEVSCQTPNDEVSLIVSIGGSVVEMP